MKVYRDFGPESVWGNEGDYDLEFHSFEKTVYIAMALLALVSAAIIYTTFI